MIKTEFEFGERIYVTGSLRRSKGFNSTRIWYRTAHEPKDAIYLSGMNLANGKVTNGEDGPEFEETERIKGAWICEKNRKPRKVFLNDCNKKEGFNNA